MFLKSLKISKGSEVIRDIKFKKGLNLIVDHSDTKITGNSVGKTTVLKLIDFCLGANKKYIWEDPENKKQSYALVKDFLISNQVLITLSLSENLEGKDSKEITIERNFIERGNEVRRNINGKFYKADEFEPKLKELILDDNSEAKPSFRQIISHNIRYKDLSLNNTLKTLDAYTSDAEYETLHLYLLGIDFESGSKKQELLEAIKQENKFKLRLEKTQTKSAYEIALTIIDNDIEKLNRRKQNLNVNENFERDLTEFNSIKYQINVTTSEITKLNIRNDLIQETMSDLESSKTDIDIQQLRMIYEQATSSLGELHKNFEDLVNYHNEMLTEKRKFVAKELPELESRIKRKDIELKKLLEEETRLASLIARSDSFEELEETIVELNEKFKLKGEYESTINQLIEVESNISDLSQSLKKIDDELFSDEFDDKVKLQLKKFNEYFSAVSEFLYNEQYALKYDIVTNSKNQRLYKFSAFNTNFSSGKKQGEISCFDIAYTLFADAENIPCLHFLLNDKKELMHDNQLVKIATFVDTKDIQFVASILKDKLPEELDDENNFIVELSEDQKLFRIENNI